MTGKCDAAICLLFDLFLFLSSNIFGGHVYWMTLFRIKLEGQKQNNNSKLHFRWILDKLKSLRRCYHFKVRPCQDNWF